MKGLLILLVFYSVTAHAQEVLIDTVKTFFVVNNYGLITTTEGNIYKIELLPIRKKDRIKPQKKITILGVVVRIKIKKHGNKS